MDASEHPALLNGELLECQGPVSTCTFLALEIFYRSLNDGFPPIIIIPFLYISILFCGGLENLYKTI